MDQTQIHSIDDKAVVDLIKAQPERTPVRLTYGYLPIEEGCAKMTATVSEAVGLVEALLNQCAALYADMSGLRPGYTVDQARDKPNRYFMTTGAIKGEEFVKRIYGLQFEFIPPEI